MAGPPTPHGASGAKGPPRRSRGPAPAVGLGPEDLPAWLDHVTGEAARVTDAFEARAEVQDNRAAALDEGGLRTFQESRLAGVCVRVWVDGAQGFASTHDASQAAARDVVERAVRLARSNARLGNPSFSYEPGPRESLHYQPQVSGDPIEAEVDDIAEVMRRAYDRVRERDPASFARARFGGWRRHLVFENGAGRRAETTTVLTTLLAKCINRSGSRLAGGTDWVSGERGLGDLVGEASPEALADRAATYAEEAARAVAAPVGHQRVLCDNALSGLLAHESFGHLTEYDLVEMGWSALGGRRGQRFAAEGVSVVDGPSVPGDERAGVRLPLDDEATRGHPVRVLDDGMLANWLHVRGSASDQGDAPLGNGRALNARFPPIVRMRNTYFEPGDLRLEEALELLDDGVYLIGGLGGAPASDGSFMFTAIRGYRVAGGEIVEPVRNTSVSGNILDFLAGVEGLTRDFSVTTIAFGGCGKWSQSYLPVGIGGPHVLVNDALVGGEAA